MHYSTLFILPIVALIAGCSGPTDSDSSVSANGSGEMRLSPPSELFDTRMLDQEALFAEVTLSFSGTSTSVIAAKETDTELWRAQLQVPTQTAFVISVVWFDLMDQQRLDLVAASNSFEPINFPGEVGLSRNFWDFDNDNFDADSDSIVNLTERLNGTLPFDASSPPTDSNTPPNTPPNDPGTPSNPIVDGYEFVNVANGAVSEISDLDDTVPVSVVQTVPVLDSPVPSSVNTPITLFFNDKLLFDSMLGNLTVVENNQQIGGTVSISESASGFAIVTFNPGRPYLDGATVALRFTGGDAGVKDDAGNNLVGNVGDDFEIAITTINQNSENFNNNFSFENFNQGVQFVGDGAVLTGTLGCFSANAGSNYAALSTGNALVSNGFAVDGTSSTVQLGPIEVGDGTAAVTFAFNFISDEFPDFLDSEFDDSAVVSISGPNGNFAGVLTTVNTVGADGFSVCPGVPGMTNRAGHTGWLSRTINFGDLGTPIVITFTITDVADTAFSSILALDNFSF